VIAGAFLEARAISIDKSPSAFHIQQVDSGLRIGIGRHEDAQCVADALSQYGSRIEHEEEAWAVVIPPPPEGSMVNDLLTALKACLDENEIPSVRVAVDDQSYVMEGST